MSYVQKLPYLNSVDQGLFIDLIEVSRLGLDDADVVHQDADVEGRDGFSNVLINLEGLVGEVGDDELGLVAVLRF